MKRREFITLLGGAAITWPVMARAQQSKVPVIGFLNSAASTPFASLVSAFREGPRGNGYVEGESIKIEYRWAEGRYDRLPLLAASLVEQKVALIVATGSTPSALAAKAATNSIPIVFVASNDPVALGLAASVNRPGGNVTGVSPVGFLDIKKLELLSMLLPKNGLIAVMRNPKNPSAKTQSGQLVAGAAALGQRIHFLDASTDEDIDTAFVMLAKMKAGALLIAGDPFLTNRYQRLVQSAARHRVPAIYGGREAVGAGGLMSYGADLSGAYFQAGVYASKILNGANVAELPIIQSSKILLVVNLKTANALGIEIPQALLARADEIIE